MTLSNDQEKALKELVAWFSSSERDQFITLGGYAGTGKTTLIAHLKSELDRIFSEKDKKLKIALCSYTGRATQNLKVRLSEHLGTTWRDKISTIHGLIYDPIETPDGVIIGWRKKEEVEVDLIIIDEASMVDELIWGDLLSYGIPIIAVGDHGQLPPIKGAFNLMQTPKLKLENIHRQASENPIIKISTHARQSGEVTPGIYSDTVIKYSQQDFDYAEASTDLLENYTKDVLILCGYNVTRVKINQFVRNALGFNLPEPQVGDRVICLRNNHTKKIFNGMLGTILNLESINPDTYHAVIKMDDGLSDYIDKIYAPQFNATAPINFTKDRAKIGKSDLFDFGYALTVHKAQGSQAKKVVLFEERFSKMTEDQWRRWLYTGITRAQEELYLFGK